MLAPRRRPLALASLCTIPFLTFLDNTVVSVALASIQSDLHGGVSELQWVVGAYALTFASLMLACGLMGDKFGPKKIMLAGAGVYLGGDAARAGRVDVPGPVLGAGALAALIFGVINGESGGYTAPSVLALFAVSLVAGAAFVLWERRAPFPLLDLSYLRVARFTTPNVVAYSTYFSTFAIFFFTALYLRVIAGVSAYRIAGLFLPMTVMQLLVALPAGPAATPGGGL